MPETAKKLQGVIVPLITPLDRNDRVQTRALGSLIRHCLNGGVQGLFVGGSSGMGPLLPEKQWQKLMESAFEQTPKNYPLLAGIICSSTAQALQRIRTLNKIGYRRMAVTPTFYITLKHEREFLTHFRKCAEATDMEMTIYNIPSCTGSFIPISVFLEAAKRGWCRMCKESSGDRAYFLELLTSGKKAGLSVFQGNEPDIAWALKKGAEGIVPVCANYNPALFAAAWQAACKGNNVSLTRLQREILAVRKVLLLGEKNWIAGIMWGVATLGIGSGRPLAPLAEPDQKEKTAIARLRLKA